MEYCLRRDGSLFTPKEAIWTKHAATVLWNRLEPAPAISGSFEEKLTWQVEPLDAKERQYAGELLYVLLLSDGSTGGQSCRKTIGIAVGEFAEIPADLAQVFDASNRIADYGPGKNRRPDHLRVLAQWAAAWKELTDTERERLLADPWAFRDFANTYRTSAGGMQIEAILHLVFPDTFEYALAPEHKERIARAFAAVGDVARADNADRKLVEVRKAVAPLVGADVSFYGGALQRIWATPESEQWRGFVDWAGRLFSHPSFESEEREYKLDAAAELRQAREALEAGREWLPILEGAFRGNNLTSWRAHDTFLKWSAANADEARTMVGGLWDAGLTGLQAFLDQLPREAAAGPGARLSIASFLLFGTDPTQLPVFRAQPYSAALKLLALERDESGPSDEIDLSRQYDPEDLAVRLGVRARAIRQFLREEFPRDEEEKGKRWWPLDDVHLQAVLEQFGRKAPRSAVLRGRYVRFLDLLDELGLRLIARGVEIRDRLDAQSLMWWVTSSGPPDDWSPEDRAAFLAFQNGMVVGSDRLGVTRRRALVSLHSRDVAAELLLDHRFVTTIVELLNEKGQVIFYGPPGTGKTYVAQRLAAEATKDGGSWQLIQFHPSYTYEDFFEGYRPEQRDDGALAFALRHGPLRRLVSAAEREPERPHLLVIDEINRGNLSKIFGELYFLLEYRRSSVRLQYTPNDEFRLPENLFLIGTMNTADRSIALVDSALRRRFYFVEFSPIEGGAVSKLLRSWLDKESYPSLAADLLDALNTAIRDIPGAGDEFAIGPAYFMTRDGPPNLERVWQYAILPLLEERFYGTLSASDVGARFSLKAIEQRLASQEPLTSRDELPDEP